MFNNFSIDEKFKMLIEIIKEVILSKISINNAENILTNVSPVFTRWFPDDSAEVEQGNAELVLGISLACFLCILHSPSDHRVNNVPKKNTP